MPAPNVTVGRRHLLGEVGSEYTYDSDVDSGVVMVTDERDGNGGRRLLQVRSKLTETRHG